MLMNYDNTIMEILQKITISAVVVLMNCDKLTIKGKITGKNNLIGMKLNGMNIIIFNILIFNLDFSLLYSLCNLFYL